MADTKTPQRLMAFWENDRFPFLLHGEVDRFVDEPGGGVKMKDWGGAVFRPLFVVPYNRGENIVQMLRRMEMQHAQEIKETHMKWQAEARAWLSLMGLRPLPAGLKEKK
jgi:hypothetical protein